MGFNGRRNRAGTSKFLFFSKGAKGGADQLFDIMVKYDMSKKQKNPKFIYGPFAYYGDTC